MPKRKATRDDADLSEFRRLKKLAESDDFFSLKVRKANADAVLIHELRTAHETATVRQKLKRSPPSRRLSVEDRELREKEALAIIGPRRPHNISNMILMLQGGRTKTSKLPASDRLLRELIHQSPRLKARLRKLPPKK